MFTIRVLCYMQIAVEPLLWDTSVRTLYSTDNSIQRVHNLVPETVQIIFVFNLLSKEHLYPGERDTFCGSRDPGLTSIQGTLQPRPQGDFFLALEVARERAMASAGQSVISLVAPPPKPGKSALGTRLGTLFKEHLPWSRGCPLNGGSTVSVCFSENESIFIDIDINTSFMLH